MRDWKTSLWHDQLRRTHDDHRQFWKLVRTFVNKRQSVHLTSGDDLLTAEEQAEILAASYAARDAERTNSAPSPPPSSSPSPNEKTIFSTFDQLESTLRLKHFKGKQGIRRGRYSLCAASNVAEEG
nr:uncharacterized protein LOC112210355 [Halyomorpha halys]